MLCEDISNTYAEEYSYAKRSLACYVILFTINTYAEEYSYANGH
jgi:hypothetical protein